MMMTNTNPEDSCVGCVHHPKTLSNILCANCKRNYDDKFESTNSRQSKFRKQFPNVKMATYAIDIRPCVIDTTLKYDGCEMQGCGNCRRAYWQEEEE